MPLDELFPLKDLSLLLTPPLPLLLQGLPLPLRLTAPLLQPWSSAKDSPVLRAGGSPECAPARPPPRPGRSLKGAPALRSERSPSHVRSSSDLLYFPFGSDIVLWRFLSRSPLVSTAVFVSSGFVPDRAEGVPRRVTSAHSSSSFSPSKAQRPFPSTGELFQRTRTPQAECNQDVRWKWSQARGLPAPRPSDPSFLRKTIPVLEIAPPPAACLPCLHPGRPQGMSEPLPPTQPILLRVFCAGSWDFILHFSFVTWVEFRAQGFFFRA
ncbi:uncharacterized protein LOC116660488 [Camelus ferus]|uniref:Uncharacterized protein LOC116660488 n=1 Tax=Camelus ferus TaxID=419612 RepID=A0A8B8S8C0_CAMFR|nr:uncharacterized protein LOC116660488 [Camelus ferus]